MGRCRSSTPDASWWLWLGCWSDAAAAREAVHDAAQWLPHQSGAVLHWSVALQPSLSRGEVNWHGAAAPPCDLTPARPTKREPIVTLTAFGIARDRTAFRGFAQRMHAARASLHAAPGMLAEFELNAVVPAFVDPCTVTLWDSEAAAMAWAYREAPHRPSMEWAQAGAIFERSSFTRCIVLAEAGERPWVDTALSAIRAA